MVAEKQHLTPDGFPAEGLAFWASLHLHNTGGAGVFYSFNLFLAIAVLRRSYRH